MAEAVSSFAEARARLAATGVTSSPIGAQDTGRWLVHLPPPDPDLILNQLMYLVDRDGNVQSLQMNSMDQATYDRIRAMPPVGDGVEQTA